jgi:hypothetical protein
MGKDIHYEDEKKIKSLQEGDSIEYDWKQSGKFKNITAVEKISSGLNQYSDEKSRQIIKMSISERTYANIAKFF